MKGLLRAPLRSGLYEVGDLDDLPAALTRAGWYVGTVDLGDARTAVAVIGDELGFPEWYGRNLDALHDCLGDLTRPTALVARVPVQLGDYGSSMLELLIERTEAGDTVPFALVRLPEQPGS